MNDLGTVKRITVDDLYLTNYRETGGLPLRNIMRLPKEEAYKIAGELSEKTSARNNRYGTYFDTYYKKRLRAEEWLYHEFIRQGGKPETTHPIYFVLCDSPNLQQFYGNEEQIRIQLKNIANKHISFTPRDSIHLMDMERTKDTVWNRNTLIKMMMEAEQSIGEFISNITAKYEKPGGYIEVQLWSDEYIRHLM
jgi:hypothetical protein